MVGVNGGPVSVKLGSRDRSRNAACLLIALHQSPDVLLELTEIRQCAVYLLEERDNISLESVPISLADGGFNSSGQVGNLGSKLGHPLAHAKRPPACLARGARWPKGASWRSG